MNRYAKRSFENPVYKNLIHPSNRKYWDMGNSEYIINSRVRPGPLFMLLKRRMKRVSGTRSMALQIVLKL